MGEEAVLTAKKQLLGILCATGASMIYGLSFLVPELVPSYSSIEVVLGRTLFYGLSSLVILLFAGVRRFKLYSWKTWFVALLFSLSGTFAYHFFVVLGIRYAGAPITTLIIGALPITLAIAGNRISKEYPLSRLFFPILLVLAGLVFLFVFQNHDFKPVDAAHQVAGLAFALIALAVWTCFGVANSIYLKKNTQITAVDWSTMMGVSSLPVLLLLLPFMRIIAGSMDMGRYFGWNSEAAAFLLVAGLAGVVISWGGAILWSKASVHLSTALAGQLIVIETIAGLVYVYVYKQILPATPEVVSILILVAGVLLGIKQTTPATKKGTRRGAFRYLKKT